MSGWHIAVDGLLVLGAAGGLYVVYVALAAYSEVAKAPKTPMFTCDKHGPFPAKYVIDLDVLDGDPVKTCPFCLEESYKKADETLKAQEAKRGARNGG